MRHVKLLLAALLVAFSVASVADAAPRKALHRRPRHSSRVSAGASVQGKKRVIVKKRVVARKKAAARSRASANHRRPVTKPR